MVAVAIVNAYCDAFCLANMNDPSVKEIGVFVTKSFTNFKKATEQLGGYCHVMGILKGSITYYVYYVMQNTTIFMMAMEKKVSRDHH